MKVIIKKTDKFSEEKSKLAAIRTIRHAFGFDLQTTVKHIENLIAYDKIEFIVPETSANLQKRWEAANVNIHNVAYNDHLELSLVPENTEMRVFEQIRELAAEALACGGTTLAEDLLKIYNKYSE